MTNSTQSNENNFFKLACLASIAAGITIAVVSLASAAPVGFAVASGLSVAVSGLLISAVIRLCCGFVGAGWESGPSVMVVDSSPSYWNRSSSWWSRPWSTGPSWLPNWGSSWNSTNVSNSRNYHGHYGAAPASSNVHGHESMKPSSFFTSTHHVRPSASEPYAQHGRSGGMFGGLGVHHHTAAPSNSGGASHHVSAPSFGGHSHGHR